MARAFAAGPATLRPSHVVESATYALKAGAEPWYQLALGLAQYRAGKYEQAIESLTKSNNSNWGCGAKARSGSPWRWHIIA